jgi:hypothetical protein
MASLTIATQNLRTSDQVLVKMTNIKEINEQLIQHTGAVLLPLSLKSISKNVHNLVTKEDHLSDDESHALLQSFKLSREEFLSALAQSKRSPHVPNLTQSDSIESNYIPAERFVAKGATTRVFPALHDVISEEDKELLKNCDFEELHVDSLSIFDDGCAGAAMDLAISLLHGSMTVYFALDYVNKKKEAMIAKLDLKCDGANDGEMGWMLVFDGGTPHGRSISERASFIVNAAGHKEFKMFSKHDNDSIPNNPFTVERGGNE